MKSAVAIIGANFGDEGKGALVDYICAKVSPDMVVRFNGGAQAGHTVTCPDGRRHVFSHFGSGSFLGVPTYLSRYFVCNPVLHWIELQKLHALNVAPKLFVDPAAAVTCPYDMLLNQAIENARGNKRHGSCGVGFNETIQRNLSNFSYRLRVRDLEHMLRDRLLLIRDEYVPKRLAELGLPADTSADLFGSEAMLDDFVKSAQDFLSSITISAFRDWDNVVFEGAQGLLLSHNNKEMFPHVTRSNTGLKNVRVLCAEAGIDDLSAIYVSRTYLTRHGAGPLPGELFRPPSDKIVDETNVPHAFQGTLRFSKLDPFALEQRIMADAGDTVPWDLAMTCCDQLKHPYELNPDYMSFGPTRGDVCHLARVKAVA